ncbi:MAG TPA: histidine kinase [Pseudonocardiaceae bacterium]|jgi:signal transduction histidine kinase|nr:histidine kinase [Pseudonocardiaceae bacterium]
MTPREPANADGPPLSWLSAATERWIVERRWWEFVPLPLLAATLLLYRGPFRIAGGSVTTYVLAGIAILASVSLLVSPTRQRVLAGTALVVLCLSSGLLTVAIPAGWTISLPYLVTSVAVRRYNPPTAIAALVAALVSIVVLAGTWRSWVSALVSVTLLAALAMGALARRNRADRLEQTELALAREQAAREEHTRAAALAERARIAREVHDVLAHSLSALALNLQSARLMLVRDAASPEAIGQVERAQRLAADGLAEARRAVAALREDPVPATRAIADLVTSTRLETGSPIELTVRGTPHNLSSSAEDTLYRTAREALSNVRKHAPGAPVRVRVDYGDERTELTVTDHPGHRPAEAAPGGYGLTGMRERAELIGGELDTGPTEDGWRVRLVVPA